MHTEGWRVCAVCCAVCWKVVEGAGGIGGTRGVSDYVLYAALYDGGYRGRAQFQSFEISIVAVFSLLSATDLSFKRAVRFESWVKLSWLCSMKLYLKAR